jgi:hypothetical protein
MMTVVTFLILIFAIFKIIAQVIRLVLTPGAVTHNIFGSLTGFIFLPLHLPVLHVLLLLLHPCRHFLNGIIVLVIFVVLDYSQCFVEVF